MQTNKVVSILGCGWYGFALAEKLLTGTYKVKASTTTQTKMEKFENAGIKPYIAVFEAETDFYDSDLFLCDVLIISIPPKRSSPDVLQYAEKIKRIKQALIKHQVKRVIFISSTSVYGDHNCEVDEHTAAQPDTASGLMMLQAEEILKDHSGFELTVLRFGGLIGPGRDPARFFAGKKNISNGKAPVNLLHLDDCIGITITIIEQNKFGYTLNACSSSHPEKMEFYTKAADISNLEQPEFIAELTSWKIVSSKYAEEILGYSFKSL